MTINHTFVIVEISSTMTIRRKNLPTATSDRLVQIEPAPTKSTATGIASFFPWHIHNELLPGQIEAFGILEKVKSIVLEAPTGSGKTGTGYTFLKWLESQIPEGGLRYIVPNKTLVEQVKVMYPDIGIAYGRNEHECFYYDDRPKADSVPCSMLEDCGHRVDQDTGETKIGGATPCPYLLQKYLFKKNRIGVCTMAFELYTGSAFSDNRERPAGLVIDEAQNLADVVRRSLSYSITDRHLEQVIGMLDEIGALDELVVIDRFYKSLVKIVKRRARGTATLLEDKEVEELISTLNDIDVGEMKKKITQAVKSQKIDTVARREILKRVETLIRDLRRYLRSFEYSLPTNGRGPTNYVFAYYIHEQADDDSEKMQYRLVIQAYSVGGIIRRMLSERTLTMSATIGNPSIFNFETGIDHPFHSISSEFPAENTRIFVPSDTPNLARDKRVKGEPTKSLRRIAKTCKTFNQHGHRCLVVVVSNLEREKFLKLCGEENVDVLSYGDGVKPKEAAERFKNGEGEVLVGTEANYGEGVDLKDQLAPIIFALRPAYAPPDDPQTQFENRKFSGGTVWAVRGARVMKRARQLRGRNIRSNGCIGVTIFWSQQFNHFVFSSLPQYLQPSYRSGITLDQCVNETLKLLK